MELGYVGLSDDAFVDISRHQFELVCVIVVAVPVPEL